MPSFSPSAFAPGAVIRLRFSSRSASEPAPRSARASFGAMRLPAYFVRGESHFVHSLNCSIAFALASAAPKSQSQLASFPTEYLIAR